MATDWIMSDEEFEVVGRPLWDYLAASDEPTPADAIFVFGGIDYQAPDLVADLYNTGFASRIAVAGNSGAVTALHFTKSEATVFRQRMLQWEFPGMGLSGKQMQRMPVRMSNLGWRSSLKTSALN